MSLLARARENTMEPMTRKRVLRGCERREISCAPPPSPLSSSFVCKEWAKSLSAALAKSITSLARRRCRHAEETVGRRARNRVIVEVLRCGIKPSDIITSASRSAREEGKRGFSKIDRLVRECVIKTRTFATFYRCDSRNKRKYSYLNMHIKMNIYEDV